MAEAGDKPADTAGLPDFLKDLALPDGLAILNDELEPETMPPVEDTNENALPEPDGSQTSPGTGPESDSFEIDQIDDDTGLYGPHFPQLKPIGDPDQLQRMVIRIEEGFKPGDRLEITDLKITPGATDAAIIGLEIIIEGGRFDENTRALILTGLASPEDYDLVVSHVALSSVDTEKTNGKRILRITATDGTGANWDAPLLILDVG
tara:strand:- start:2700 stop:3317 length:618 start_codon:yes stop_codon:yes gene_type:complete